MSCRRLEEPVGPAILRHHANTASMFRCNPSPYHTVTLILLSRCYNSLQSVFQSSLRIDTKLSYNHNTHYADTCCAAAASLYFLIHIQPVRATTAELLLCLLLFLNLGLRYDCSLVIIVEFDYFITELVIYIIQYLGCIAQTVWTVRRCNM